MLDKVCAWGSKRTQNYLGALIMLENYCDLEFQHACSYSMQYSQLEILLGDCKAGAITSLSDFGGALGLLILCSGPGLCVKMTLTLYPTPCPFFCTESAM